MHPEETQGAYDKLRQPAGESCRSAGAPEVKTVSIRDVRKMRGASRSRTGPKTVR
jgi:hypothetical protein